MKYVIGIDMGTQSIKASVVSEKLEIIKTTSIQQQLYTPTWDKMEQDPNLWFESLIKCLKYLVENSSVDAKDINAICICGIMHTPVPIGRNGELLTDRVQIHSDKRTTKIVEEFSSGGNAERAYELTGNIPATTWNGFKIKWIQENQPEIYEKTWKFLAAKDYLNFKLTGIAAIDVSEMSGTYLMDWKTEEWSQEMTDMLGIDIDKMPEKRVATDVLGPITDEVAQLSGLKRGTLVTVGSSDMHTALVANGIIEPGIVSTGIGTASGVTLCTEKPILDKHVLNLKNVTEGWSTFAVIDCAGGALRWCRDTICEYEMEIAKKEGKNAFNLMNALAAQSEPGSEHLIFLPYLLGERNNLGSAYSRGCFIGLSMGTKKRDCIRAVMEGVAFEIRRIMEIFKSSGAEIKKVIFGGGGKNSEIWMQIISNVLQHDLVTLSDVEAGIMGSAIFAGVSVGIFGDLLSTVRTHLSIDNVLPYNPESKRIYDETFKVYLELHDVLLDKFRKLMTI